MTDATAKGVPRWATQRVRSSILAWGREELPADRVALVDGLARRTGISRRLVRVALDELARMAVGEAGGEP